MIYNMMIQSNIIAVIWVLKIIFYLFSAFKHFYSTAVQDTLSVEIAQNIVLFNFLFTSVNTQLFKTKIK